MIWSHFNFSFNPVICRSYFEAMRWLHQTGRWDRDAASADRVIPNSFKPHEVELQLCSILFLGTYYNYTFSIFFVGTYTFSIFFVGTYTLSIFFFGTYTFSTFFVGTCNFSILFLGTYTLTSSNNFRWLIPSFHNAHAWQLLTVWQKSSLTHIIWWVHNLLWINDIIDILTSLILFGQVGRAIAKKYEHHKQCEQNRAYAHYRRTK